MTQKKRSVAARLLAKYKKVHNLSNPDAAKALGLSLSTFDRIRLGYIECSVASAKRIAPKFGRQWHEIVGG